MVSRRARLIDLTMDLSTRRHPGAIGILILVLLFDGMKGELEISPHEEVEEEDFERAWNAAVSNVS